MQSGDLSRRNSPGCSGAPSVLVALRIWRDVNGLALAVSSSAAVLRSILLLPFVDRLIAPAYGMAISSHAPFNGYHTGIFKRSDPMKLVIYPLEQAKVWKKREDGITLLRGVQWGVEPVAADLAVQQKTSCPCCCPPGGRLD